MKLAPAQREQFLQCALSFEATRLGMNQTSIFDENLSTDALAENFENERMAARTLHLQKVFEIEAAHDTSKTGFNPPLQQLVQSRHEDLELLGRQRLFQYQFSAAAGCGRTALRIGVRSEDCLFESRIF